MSASLLDRLCDHLSTQTRTGLDVAISVAGGRALYLVGGGVRDLLLGATHLDLDLVTEDDTLALASEVGRRLDARVTLHPRFDTAVVQGEGLRIDVARARSESYARPGALPAVRPGTVVDDLARRDFTINALALCLNGPHAGVLIDPHDGRSDLDRRLIRALHDASFQDDATRILRVVRYAARLGFTVEPHTASLLRRDLSCLDTITGVRIRRELERIAVEERVGDAMRLAQELGSLAAIHPALRAGERELRASANLGTLAPSHRDAVLLAVLLADASPGEAEAAIARLSLTGRQATAVRSLRALRERESTLARPALRPSDVVAIFSDHPAEAIEAFSLLAEPSAAERATAYLRHWRHVRPRLDGHDIERLGVPHGPRVGEALAALHRARLDGEVKYREDEIALVHSTFVARPLAGVRGG